MAKNCDLFNRTCELRIDRSEYPDYPNQFAVDGGISIHPHPPLVIARPLLGSGVLFCTVDAKSLIDQRTRLTVWI